MGPAAVLTRTFRAVPEAIAEARHAVAAFARAAGARELTVDDVQLVVSEAVSNVVLHAYEGRTGSVHITAAIAEEELWVLVADDGDGFRAEHRSSGLGLGLPLIAQLSTDFAIESGARGGIELKMRFPISAGSPAAARPPRLREGPALRETAQLRG